MEFTHTAIKALKPREKTYEIRDDKTTGLFVTVSVTGTRSFVWRGRIDGRPSRKTLGRFGDMTLAQAREAVEDLRRALRRGTVKSAKTMRGGMTTSEAFALYMEREGNTKGRPQERWAIFENNVEPFLGVKPIALVEHEDLEAVIRTKFDSGAHAAANRLHSLLSRFFNWCLSEGRSEVGLKSNPFQHVKKMAPASKPRRRAFSDVELRWFTEALHENGNGFAAPLELALRTVLRLGNVFNLTWGEVSDDRTKLVITKTKNGFPHAVYLTESAAALLPTRDGAKSTDRVFSVTQTTTRVVRRLRSAMEDKAAKIGEKVEPWRLHDMRRTANTKLASMLDERDRQLFGSHVRQRVLAHRDTSVEGEVYDVHDNWAETKAAITAWNDWLDNNT